MKTYRVFVPIVRWQEWRVEAEDAEDACHLVVRRGKGKLIEEEDSSDIGVGTYAEEIKE